MTGAVASGERRMVGRFKFTSAWSVVVGSVGCNGIGQLHEKSACFDQ